MAFMAAAFHSDLHLHDVLVCLEKPVAHLQHELERQAGLFELNHHLVQVLHIPSGQALQAGLAGQQLVIDLSQALADHVPEHTRSFRPGHAGRGNLVGRKQTRQLLDRNGADRRQRAHVEPPMSSAFKAMVRAAFIAATFAS